MSVEFQVKCEELGQEYLTLVHCNIEGLAEFVTQDNAKNKVGEDFIAALREEMPQNIYSIERYVNRKENDSPNGKPAYEKFNKDGKLVKVMHLKNNEKHDSIHGEPAEQIYSNDGSRLVALYRYKDGNDCMGPNGEPSNMRWNEKGALVFISWHSPEGGLTAAPEGWPSMQCWYEDGTPETAIYYNKNNNAHNGPNGEPHRREWNANGQLVCVEEYDDGELISKAKYDDEQTLAKKKEAELKAQKREMLKDAISKACPVVEFETTVTPHIFGL